MPQQLAQKLNDILSKLDTCPTSARAALAAELETVASKLDAMGEPVPAATRLRAQEILDEAVEDQFDNLPL